MHRWLLYAALLLSAACAADGGAKQLPSIQDGRLDLSDWDFESDGALNFDGRVALRLEVLCRHPVRYRGHRRMNSLRVLKFPDIGRVGLKFHRRRASLEFIGLCNLCCPRLMDFKDGPYRYLCQMFSLPCACTPSMIEGERSKRYCRGQPGTTAEDEIGFIIVTR